MGRSGRVIGALALAWCFAARAAPPGLPAIRTPFAGLKPAASWPIGKTAGWVAITPDAVWVGGTAR